jgi:hypothetical protein
MSWIEPRIAGRPLDYTYLTYARLPVVIAAARQDAATTY